MSWTQGTDGRRIPLPPNWSWIQGTDGRRIPLPPNWSWTQGTDGRRIPLPPNCNWTQGTDGRRISIDGVNRIFNFPHFDVIICDSSMIFVLANGFIIAHEY